MPDTFQDYNIVSNLSHGVHHWAHPDDRPTGEGGRYRRVVIGWSVAVVIVGCLGGTSDTISGCKGL